MFVQENELGEKLKIVGSKELKDSYGNVLKTQSATVPSFRIGEAVPHDVTAGFFEGAIGRQKMSILGGEILKRFRIVIDGKREFISQTARAERLSRLSFIRLAKSGYRKPLPMHGATR